jgi:hydrogenase 3 maturation protease
MDIGEIFEQLREFGGNKTVIVGIGNVLKGDDGAGPLICQQLKGKICAETIDAGTVPENYIQLIIKKAPQKLIIIDAVHFEAPAGTIDVFEPQQLNSLVISTHTLSARLFIDMICRSIKADVYFIGIQPAQTDLGQPVSPEVNAAIGQLLHVLNEIFPLGS